MQRRVFLHLGGAGLLSLLSHQCSWQKRLKIDFPFEFISDMKAGHVLLEQREQKISKEIKTDILIVGGGIAGVSAARHLGERDYLLCEVAPRLGGSSSSYRHKEQLLCQGAHYDLAYPENYGQEVLDFMKQLKLIQYDAFHRCWTFTDRKYLIPANKEVRCFDNGIFREDVLPAGEEKTKLIELMAPYSGKMLMPTRLIDQKHQHLNTISFDSWLTDRMSLSKQFRNGLDYNMMDDYGAGIEEISALAGIHYYMCRPYFKQPVDLFSPPEGNYYFIKKICADIPASKILTGHLITKMDRDVNGVFADAIDFTNNSKIRFRCRKLIFAGQKHALKYIFPADFPLFEHNEYSPWAVVNFVLSEAPPGAVYWQNEILSNNKSVLGFVNSLSQFQGTSCTPVLTTYCCFPPKERQYLADIPLRANQFLSNIVGHINNYFDQDILPIISKSFIKLMGHAMPIPKPGYLFKDRNALRSDKDIIYAGVDTGRLPLLFEAIDSGLMAAKIASE
jgi:protoporphyrinogen oxidase